MRIIVDCLDTAGVGETGSIKIELGRKGLHVLEAEQPFAIVETPKVEAKSIKTTLPDFNVIEVKNIQDPNWSQFPEKMAPDKIASVAVQNEGVLDIYYSAIFPPYAAELKAFEGKDPKLAEVFVARYKTWLAVHSLLLLQDNENAPIQPVDSRISEDQMEVIEQQERVRLAVVATLMAKKEARLGDAFIDSQ